MNGFDLRLGVVEILLQVGDVAEAAYDSPRSRLGSCGINTRPNKPVEGELSDRLGDYWLLALGMLFVVTVVLMPTGLFGRVLMPQLPKRLRGES
jgi:ABC-type branched-subunit amino acid transport system permease subunit